MSFWNGSRLTLLLLLVGAAPLEARARACWCRRRESDLASRAATLQDILEQANALGATPAAAVALLALAEIRLGASEPLAAVAALEEATRRLGLDGDQELLLWIRALRAELALADGDLRELSASLDGAVDAANRCRDAELKGRLLGASAAAAAARHGRYAEWMADEAASLLERAGAQRHVARLSMALAHGLRRTGHLVEALAK